MPRLADTPCAEPGCRSPPERGWHGPSPLARRPGGGGEGHADEARVSRPVGNGWEPPRSSCACLLDARLLDADPARCGPGGRASPPRRVPVIPGTSGAAPGTARCTLRRGPRAVLGHRSGHGSPTRSRLWTGRARRAGPVSSRLDGEIRTRHKIFVTVASRE